MKHLREFSRFVNLLRLIGMLSIGLCSLPATAANPLDQFPFRVDSTHAAQIAEGSVDEMREWLRDRDLERRFDSPRPSSADEAYAPETGTIIEEGYRPYRPIYRGHRKSYRSHSGKRYRTRYGKTRRHSTHASKYARGAGHRIRGSVVKSRRVRDSAQATHALSPRRSGKSALLKAQSTHRAVPRQPKGTRRSLKNRR